MNKLGLIIGTLPACYRGIAAGGIATHIEGLIKSLHQKGIRTYICYHKPFGVKHPEVMASSKMAWSVAVLKGSLMLLFVHEHKWRKYSFKTNLLIAYYCGVLKCFLKKVHPDFVHIHSLYNPSPIVLKYLKYSGPIIITDHGFWVNENYSCNPHLLFLLQKTFSIATKVVYISDMALFYHQKVQLGDLNKLVKISNPSFFENYPCKENVQTKAKQILIFNGYGNSLTIKGLPFLLNAVNADTYLCQHLKLQIICNDEAHDYIQQRKWNFEYVLYGRTKFSDVLNMYTQSDILVVPSKFESFGLVYTEALAVGIPVIGYYAMINEFQKTLNTYIGEPIDIVHEQPKDLAQKIKKCLVTPFAQEEVRAALIKAYDWNFLINRFLSLYYAPKTAE